MKTTITGFHSKALALITSLATLALTGRSAAEIALGAGVSVETEYTHSASDNIVSFDRDANGNLYYLTAALGFGPGAGFWKGTPGTPTSIYADEDRFAGNSVVTIGDYVYFNESTQGGAQLIHGYGPLSGSAGTPSTTSTANYALAAHNGSLYIAGSLDFGSNQLYHATPSGAGLTPAIQIGDTASLDQDDLPKFIGAGPLTFDAAGNLYYAQGYGEFAIYKWSAQEVADAVADPGSEMLTTPGHLWLDYSSIYTAVDGASALAFDGAGELLISLTSFNPENPSVLARFGVSATGAYAGTAETILTETGRLGDVRNFDGEVYVSAENKIYHVVPEPASMLMLAVGAGLLAMGRRGRGARL